MEDEYWGEPDIYELGSEVDAFKRKLIDSAKQEIKDRFQRLESENTEMKVRLKNLDELESDAITAKRAADNAASNAERTVKYKRANELFKEVAEEKFLITYSHFYGDECGKCVDRKVEFTYPSGKIGHEACERCGNMRTKQVVTEALGTSVDIRRGELMIWYVPYRDWDDGEYNSMSGSVKKKFNGQPFEDLNKYDTVFDSRQDAQEYADYLNKIEAV